MNIDQGSAVLVLALMLACALPLLYRARRRRVARRRLPDTAAMAAITEPPPLPPQTASPTPPLADAVSSQFRAEIDTLLRAGPARHAIVARPLSTVAKLLVLHAPLATDPGNIVVEALDLGKFNGPDRHEKADEIRTALGLLRAQTQSAQRWESGLDESLLDAFPGVEIILIKPECEPTGWHERWRQAGGRHIAGRYVALKTSGVLQRFNVFGHPFPPFDWSDALDESDIDRRDAEALGLSPK